MVILKTRRKKARKRKKERKRESGTEGDTGNYLPSLVLFSTS